MYASGLRDIRVLGTLKMLTGRPASSLSFRPSSSSRARLICITHSWSKLGFDGSMAFNSEDIVARFRPERRVKAREMCLEEREKCT